MATLADRLTDRHLSEAAGANRNCRQNNQLTSAITVTRLVTITQLLSGKVSQNSVCCSYNVKWLKRNRPRKLRTW